MQTCPPPPSKLSLKAPVPQPPHQRHLGWQVWTQVFASFLSSVNPALGLGTSTLTSTHLPAPSSLGVSAQRAISCHLCTHKKGHGCPSCKSTPLFQTSAIRYRQEGTLYTLMVCILLHPFGRSLKAWHIVQLKITWKVPRESDLMVCPKQQLFSTLIKSAPADRGTQCKPDSGLH